MAKAKPVRVHWVPLLKCAPPGGRPVRSYLFWDDASAQLAATPAAGAHIWRCNGCLTRLVAASDSDLERMFEAACPRCHWRRWYE